ncbi:histidine phosphatase family protein [Streptomyces sp. NP160]|uniref:histidine phosphatase family protein n=1 Tax=Streptomyces sp. NP160 TaxID=2586637 RepID=UPI001118DED5|nr:histidine phosphatase family protein [Streptomyces sp. NP160]TNM63175.1 histidine phosphatase family protein [Streptomyces sp. NP160]
MSEKPSAVPQQLLLLRHGQVASHRGDVPVTDEGLVTAREVGRHLAERGLPLNLLCGSTRRTRETAEAIAQGARSAGARVLGPQVAAGLRNPDLYLAGARVDMVSSAEAFTAQVPDLDVETVTNSAFYEKWLVSGDRVGWWLDHPSPPGDDGHDVVRRVRRFAASLADLPAEVLTVGVTHSPVLRACLRDVTGEDAGEPAWVAGLEGRVEVDRTVHLRPLLQAPTGSAATPG